MEGGAERATSATEEHRRRGRKKGSINIKREPYRREEHVDLASEPDSIISFNTRSMVKRRVELLNAGKLKEGELFQNVEAFSDSNATPSNLDMRFKEVAQSKNSGSVISTPFKRAIGMIRGSDSGRKTPDTEKKRRERRVHNARRKVDGSSFMTSLYSLVAIACLCLFIAGLYQHEMIVNSLNYGDHHPNNWDPQNGTCKIGYRRMGHQCVDIKSSLEEKEFFSLLRSVENHIKNRAIHTCEETPTTVLLREEIRSHFRGGEDFKESSMRHLRDIAISDPYFKHMYTLTDNNDLRLKQHL